MFVGWDWASTTHDVTVIDDAGRIVDRWAPEHTEMGLDATMARLTCHGRPEKLPVAIERPSGLVVDRLLAAGHPVIPIHPNAFHAARPRWGAAAAKSDPGDSFKLADYLRTDGHRLRRLRPLDAATRELQRCRGCVTTMWPPRPLPATSFSARCWTPTGPAPSRSFPGSAPRSPWPSWTLIRPPESAARLGEARLAAFCRRHSYRGGRSPAELLGRSAPAALVGLAPEVLAELVGAQVRLLRILLATIAELDALGAGLLGHAKAKLLAPLPRIGEISLAQVVAEVGPILDRASTVEHATAECGAAPVTKASGKSKAVTFRWARPTPRPATPLPPSPATPGTAHRRPRSTALTPAAAASTIPTPSASSLGPGSGSSGLAGTPTRPTTPPGTAQNGGSPPELDSGNSSATSPERSSPCCTSWPNRTRQPPLDLYRSVQGHRELRRWPGPPHRRRRPGAPRTSCPPMSPSLRQGAGNWVAARSWNALRLRPWAHMLGFGGHWSTKSRRYPPPWAPCGGPGSPSPGVAEPPVVAS